ncbi:hypothetical protein IMSAG185_00376 [Lachnospiraceae bacterium]|jgi:sugar-specific transcriptional regulator TrmB|nr:TrmB family transcriptional regulator [Lachnospiraceae bacterium]GFI64786.1 hypothetical protein IMSAG185_00376 [Lachnospiraceae bacterium]
MEEAEFTEKLLLFGLGRQEALLYRCLLQSGELTGYEAAKLTGISRSNVYNGLASLTEHGAAYVLEGMPKRYTAVGLEEFCDNRIRYLREVGKQLVKNCPGPAAESEGYITVEGYQHICDKIHHMLLGARERIYFSASGGFLARWREEIGEQVRLDRKVVLLSGDADAVFAGEKELREGIIFYEIPSGMNEGRESQVRLIIDSAYVLTGEVEGGSRDTCLYSAQKNFVAVFKDAMRNEIELVRIREGKS